MTPTGNAAIARRATLVLLGLLIGLSALETLLRPPALLAAAVFVVALKTLPLAGFIVPLQRARTTSALWLVLVLLPFFCLAVLAAMAPGLPGWLALVKAVLMAGCAGSAMLFARWGGKREESGEAQAPLP